MWHIERIFAKAKLQKHKQSLKSNIRSIIKSIKKWGFKHRLAVKVNRLIALMTPTESCGLDGVSVTSSHHVSQSQQ